MKTPLLERFLEKVDTSGSCWAWKGDKNPQGYGRCYLFSGSYRLAHRVAWELERGAIPLGLCVLHRCDNPSCVRVDHLFLGTRGDNNRDRERKGRGARLRGSAHGCAKLTEAQVREIRERYGWVRLGQGRRPTGQPTNGQIAKEYGVTHSQISLILRRKEWAHL